MINYSQIVSGLCLELHLLYSIEHELQRRAEFQEKFNRIEEAFKKQCEEQYRQRITNLETDVSTAQQKDAVQTQQIAQLEEEKKALSDQMEEEKKTLTSQTEEMKNLQEENEKLKDIAQKYEELQKVLWS